MLEEKRNDRKEKWLEMVQKKEKTEVYRVREIE